MRDTTLGGFWLKTQNTGDEPIQPRPKRPVECNMDAEHVPEFR